MDITTAALTIIDEEYRLVRTSTDSTQKAAHYNNIIQIRAALNQKNKNEVYLDIKNFIKHYVASVDDLNFGYDNISFSKISNCIIIDDIEAAISLNKYALKQLKTHGYLDAAKDCEAEILSLTRMFLKSKRSFYNLLHWFYLITTQSKTSILLSLFITTLSSTLILLPSHTAYFACITFSTAKYCENFLANRFVNTLVLMTGIDDSVKVSPNNIWGCLLLLTGKIYFLLVVGSILLKQLKSKINLD